MTASNLWKRHCQHLSRVPAIGLTLDVSRMRFDEEWLERMAPAAQRAFEAMDALERGAIANPDENRMVGHYWLRAPQLAPRPEIAEEIRKTVAGIKTFAAGVHSGSIRPPNAPRFTRVLVIGIGGLKVVTASGWFAARPSGTENHYKIYAESFTSQAHLDAIVAEARQIVAQALALRK